MKNTEILLANIATSRKKYEKAMSLGFNEEYLRDPVEAEIMNAIRRTESEGKAYSVAAFMIRLNDGARLLLERLAKVASEFRTDKIDDLIRLVVTEKNLEDAKLLSSQITESLRKLEAKDDISAITSASKMLARNIESVRDINAPKVITGAEMQGNYLDYCVKRIEAAESGNLGISTGISYIDTCFGGGFRPRELILVGGRTGIGKTQFGIHAAMQAVNAGQKVLFFSSEMDRNALLDRVCSRISSVDSRKIRMGVLSDKDHKAFERAIKKLSSNDNLVIYDDFRCKLAAIETAVEIEMRSTKPPAMIVVDYAQNIRTETKHRDKIQEYQEVSWTLKQLCVRYPVCIILLAQLNRGAVGVVPEVHHIAGCDSFAHDCDGAIILHQTQQMKDHGYMVWRLRKMRYGEEGNHGVGASLSISSFTELSGEQQRELQTMPD